MNPRGPISWPIKIDDSKTRHFDLYYFEFENSRYVVGIVGKTDDQPIPLRIESACVFGHIFRGLKCDCGEQFEMALKEMIRRNHGIVAYALDDDARGHGIEMHFKLYELRQHEGRLDEREIFNDMGLELDARDYAPVIDILDYFDIERVELMTNNPERIKALSEAGIDVADRIPIESEITKYNEQLLLQEKEWLQYETTYKTLEEWAEYFIQEQERHRGQYGFIVTLDHRDVAKSRFFDQKPSNLEIDLTDDSLFTTLIANFDPPGSVQNAVDKVLILGEDGQPRRELSPNDSKY